MSIGKAKNMAKKMVAEHEKNLNGKKQLLEKIKKNGIEQKDVKGIEVENDTKSLLKEIKQLKKQLEKTESLLNAEKKANRQLEDQILQHKEEVKEYRTSYEQQVKENEEIQKDNENLLSKINAMNIILKEYESRIEQLSSANLEQKINDLENEIMSLEFELNSQKRANSYLNEKLKTYEKDKDLHDKKLAGQRKLYLLKINSLENKLNELESINKNLRKQPSINDIFNNLIQSINLNNFHDYSEVEKLYQRYKTLKGQYKKKILEEEIERQTLEGINIGYIVYSEDGKWIFYNLKNELYEVCSSSIKLKDGNPVKVELRKDGRVHVVQSYDIGSLTTKKEKQTFQKVGNKLNRISVNRGKKEIYLNFGTYKALIIGSRNMASYKDRLERHGLEVRIINPYEDSLNIIIPSSQWADVIIVCTSHVSHAVMDILKTFDNSSKIEYIKDDSREAIATRVRYNFIKNGLLNLTK